MRKFIWDENKNEKIKKERGISFEEIADAIEAGFLLKGEPHHNPKYAHQVLLHVCLNKYVYTVPSEVNEGKIKFATVYPNRKAKKLYMGEKT